MEIGVEYVLLGGKTVMTTHTATVSSKGQVVIPAELRKRFNLRPSTKIVFGVENGKLTLEPTAFDEVMALEGCLADVQEDMEAILIDERRKDRGRDERKYAEL